MPADSRRIINASITLLALGLCVLAGNMAWNAYRGLDTAKRVALVNAMADKLIRTASITAVERGMTAAALGERGPISPAMMQQVRDARRATDASWNGALAIARDIMPKLPSDSTFSDVLNNSATRSRQALDNARRRVDDSLRKKKGGISGLEWIAVVSRFIEDTDKLFQAALSPSDVPHEVTHSNMLIKHRAWSMGEYAGRERGILAYYIGGHLPVPAAVLDDLKSYRGVVIYNLEALRGLKDLADVDPRIRRSIETMEQEFIERFGKIQMAVYAASATGHYPISAATWVETATASINSILAVMAASSQVIEDKVQKTIERNRGLLALYLMLVSASFMLAIVSMTRVRKTANALFHEKELAEVTLHSIGDAVITVDVHGNVDYLNPIAETLTGWGVTEAKGRPLREIFHIVNGVTRESRVNPAEKCLRENRIIGLENNTVLIARDGTERVIEDSAAPICDREGDVVGAVMVFYDVTLMRNSPHLLSYQATHDALTGLVNRREFERRLTTLVESAKAKDLHHVLCYMDLDQFKVVNDTCGHIAGDKLLRQIAFLLKNRVRDMDALARLGGDEFGLLLESCAMEPALRLVNDLARLVNDFRFVWGGTTFEIGVSIGVVPVTSESVSPVDLMSQADAACYAAKDKGRNRVQVYRPEDVEIQQRHGEMQWVSRIQQALKEDRFVLYCHKILPLSNGADGHQYCETLLRMFDESGNIVPPMAFLPAAERYNLMLAIDRWVVRQALAAFGKHRRENPESNVDCFINLSGTSLSDDHMFDFIREQSEASGVRPGSVCFEITETAAVAHFDLAIAFMRRLKNMGCRFALDDFGSGMSSFAYLKNLPVDYLKIAGAFVRNMAKNPVDYTMVDAINHVGHVMGIQTIAEFVENDATLEKLRGLGVDFAQGFGIAQPQPLADYLPTLRAKSDS